MSKSVSNHRIRLTPRQEQELLDETKGFCPLCGRPLVEEKNGRRLRAFEGAHIYPHSPTAEQREFLKDVEKPQDIESLDNIILLCLGCHNRQDFMTTLDDYLFLYKRKQQISAQYRSAQETSYIELLPEFKDILRRLSKVADPESVELTYKPFNVARKIEPGPLRRKVRNLVASYYSELQAQFRELDDIRTSAFERIAHQFRLAFLAQKEHMLILDKEEVFDGLVDWVQSKTHGSRTGCEVVVSFFVQNCEVFDAIPE